MNCCILASSSRRAGSSSFDSWYSREVRSNIKRSRSRRSASSRYPAIRLYKPGKHRPITKAAIISEEPINFQQALRAAGSASRNTRELSMGLM